MPVGPRSFLQILGDSMSRSERAAQAVRRLQGESSIRRNALSEFDYDRLAGIGISDTRGSYATMKQEQNTSQSLQSTDFANYARGAGLGPGDVPSELNFYESEVARREHGIAQLEIDIANAKALALAAGVEIEIGEGRLVEGKITESEFSDLRKSLVEFEGTVAILTFEHRIAVRILDKARIALETVRASYEAANRANSKRQVLEILAPAIDAIVEAATKLAGLDGVAGMLASWLVSQDHPGKSTNIRFAAMHIAFFIRQILDGDGIFLAAWIQDLQRSAPDQITFTMENFLIGHALQQTLRLEVKRNEERRRRTSVLARIKPITPCSEPFGEFKLDQAADRATA